MHLRQNSVMATLEEERDREPHDPGPTVNASVPPHTTGFAAPYPRQEEGQVADSSEGTRQDAARRQEVLHEWMRTHEHPTEETRNYEQDRPFIMSSLSDLVLATAKTQATLAEISKRQQDAYEGTCMSEHLLHDLDQTIHRLQEKWQT